MLKIGNKTISTSIWIILKDIRSEIHNNKLKDIRMRGNNIRVTCPFHKNGLEQRPSCDIYVGDDSSVEYGWFKCFTCSEQGPFYKFVAECFEQSEEWAKQWLVDRYSDGLIEYEIDLPEIDISVHKKEILDESVLSKLESWHPYLEKRKLTKEVAKEFEIGFDKDTNMIVFPVRDEHGDLSLLTRRSVVDKTFIIDANKEKPVYLLYYLLKHNIKEAFICESQINALTLWTHGLPGVALFGTGSSKQYEILNKSSIRVYNLCFDGDAAGDKGIEKFLKNIRKDVIINVIHLPRGKDINDLSYDEVEQLIQKELEF